jgi:hypothetical protein
MLPSERVGGRLDLVHGVMLSASMEREVVPGPIDNTFQARVHAHL